MRSGPGPTTFSLVLPGMSARRRGAASPRRCSPAAAAARGHGGATRRRRLRPHGDDRRAWRSSRASGTEGGFDAADDLSRRGAGRGHRDLAVRLRRPRLAPRRRRRRRRRRAPGFVLNGDGEIVTNAHVVTHRRGRREQARPRGLRRVRRRQPRAGASRRRTTRTPTSRCSVDTKGLTLRPLPLGDERRVAGRRAGGGDRLAVRRAPVAVGRHRLGRRPLDRVADATSRSRARSRPTRRSTPATRAARWSTPTAGDRDQPADPDQVGRRRGRRLRGADRRRQALARPAARDGPARTTPTSASPRCRSTRSSSSSFHLTSTRARGSRRSARRRRRTGRACAAARRHDASRVRVPPGRRRHHEGRGRADHATPTTSPTAIARSSRARTVDRRGPPRRRQGPQGEDPRTTVKARRAPAGGVQSERRMAEPRRSSWSPTGAR